MIYFEKFCDIPRTLTLVLVTVLVGCIKSTLQGRWIIVEKNIFSLLRNIEICLFEQIYLSRPKSYMIVGFCLFVYDRKITKKNCSVDLHQFSTVGSWPNIELIEILEMILNQFGIQEFFHGTRKQ